MPVWRCSRAASTWPTPPPTSATVPAAQGDQSNSCQAGSESEAAQPSDCGFSTAALELPTCKRLRAAETRQCHHGMAQQHGKLSTSAQWPSSHHTCRIAGMPLALAAFMAPSKYACCSLCCGRGGGTRAVQLRQRMAARRGSVCYCPTP